MPQLRVNRVRHLSRITVEDGPITMGRSSQNTVVLPHTSVSRVHCSVEVVAGEPRLRDHGSRHGTKLNGRRIEGEAALYDGDRIGVGPFQIEYGDAGRPRRPESPGDEAAVEQLARASAIRQRRHDELAGALDVRTRDVDERERAIEAREQAVAERAQQLALAETEVEQHRAERDGSVSVLRAELDGLQSALAARQAELAEARLATTAEERRARELEAELTEAHQQQGRLEAELEEAARRQDEREQRSRQELDVRSRRLDEAVELGASLKDRIKQLEEATQDAARRTDHAEQALRRFETTVKQLSSLSQRLSRSQTNLRGLEALWTETSEWLEQTDKSDLVTLRHLIQQRDSVGEQLEVAHGERDDLLAELQAQVDALTELTAAERREWDTVIRRPQTRSFLGGITRRGGR